MGEPHDPPRHPHGDEQHHEARTAEAPVAEALAPVNGDKKIGRYSPGKCRLFKLCVNTLGSPQGAHVRIKRRKRLGDSVTEAGVSGLMTQLVDYLPYDHFSF